MSASRGVSINGREFNTGWVDVVEWEVTAVTGLGDPEAVATSEQNVGRDGTWSTTAFRGPRSVGVEGAIRADSEALLEQAEAELRRLVGLDVWPLTLHYASGDRTIWVRRDGAPTFDSRESPTELTWSFALKADDPAIYLGDASGSSNVTLATGLPHTDGGLTYPITYPITYSGSAATGDMSTTLAGGGKLTFRIGGPVTDPAVTVVNDLGAFRLAWSGTIPSGMWLDVDPTLRQALLQSQTSRVPTVRQWPKLAPGVNTFRFRAAEYSAGTLTATIRPTV